MLRHTDRARILEKGARSPISGEAKKYTDQEFAVILRKASELSRSSDVAVHRQDGVSLAEMKAIAEELGMDPILIERAAHLMPAGSTESGLERVLGGPVKHRLNAYFSTKLTEERAAHLLSVVRAAAEQQGVGEANASGMSWHSAGEENQILVTAHTEGEGTRVRVVVDRRGGLAIIGTFSLLATISVGIVTLVGLEALDVGSYVVGWTIMGGGLAGSVAAGRAVWASTSRKIREKVNALMVTVSRTLEDDGGGDSEE